MQIDSSSTSSEISFHGLPSKSKRPSIRKHNVIVIITFDSMFLRNSHLQRGILQIFFRQYFREFLENHSSASKYVPKRFRNFIKIHPLRSLIS